MDDEHEESLIRVFSKVKTVNHLINDVTIGPNSLRRLSITESHNSSSPKTPSYMLNKKNESTSNSDLNSEHGVPTRQLLKLMDLERQEQVQSALNERCSRFDQFSKVQEEQFKQSWLRNQQALIEDMEKQELTILKANQQYESSHHARMVQLTQNALLRNKQRQEILKEKEKQKQLLMERMNEIASEQKKFTLEFQQILEIFKDCTDSDELRTHEELDFSLLKTLPAEVESIFEKLRGDNIFSITAEDVQRCKEAVNRIAEFNKLFRNVVESINKRKKQQEQEKISKQQNIEIAKQAVTQVTTESVPIVSSNQSSHIVTSNTTGREIPIEKESLNKLSKYVSINDLQIYTELITFLDGYRKSFAQLESDPSLKTFKFDCKKAINIPVNSLSGVNSEHIMDKYRKLHRLLTGQSVLISDKEINASKHPQGIQFCMDLLARKFVLQGDLMVSSNPESAFCYATVMLSLWNDFPDFGKLLLANFYKMCPYLVPYYIPKQVGESDEEFYMKLGYQYQDGEVEKQDKFLKRMTGIMKLFFATMIAKPKKGQNSSPHNIKHGWKWLASFLRLEPQLDITATALHVFLDTVGFEMDAKYGNMFQKLLTLIIKVFLPKCEEVKCTGGAVTRLELLLTDYMKNRRFEKPNGYIEYAYW